MKRLSAIGHLSKHFSHIRFKESSEHFPRGKNQVKKQPFSGQGLEEETGETGDQVARREETEEKEKCERVMTPGNSLAEESRKGKETAERSSSEDRGTDIEMEGEHGTEEEETGRQLLDGKGLRPGTQMLATHSYKKNPNGPVETSWI